MIPLRVNEYPVARRRLTASLPLFLTIALMTALVPATPASAAAPGTPYTWGGNQYGQLGNGTTIAHLTPHATACSPMRSTWWRSRSRYRSSS